MLKELLEVDQDSEKLDALARQIQSSELLGMTGWADLTPIQSQLKDLPVEDQNYLLFMIRFLAKEELPNIGDCLDDYQQGIINPSLALQKFTLGVCKLRGWIDSERVAELQAMNSTEVSQEIDRVLRENARLRNGPVRKLRLNPGETAQDVLERDFDDSRFELEKLLVRWLSDTQYLGEAISTGNDRTSPHVWEYRTNGLLDGEKLAMIKVGITNAADTTYVMRGESLRNLITPPFLIYSPDCLVAIEPAKRPRLNGFHCFIGSSDMKARSLLAIIE